VRAMTSGRCRVSQAALGAVWMEDNDEWAAFPRRYFSQTSMAKLEAGAHAPEELRDSQRQLA